MPGPVGNKHALGNDGGRPKEYDRIQIGKDFVEWATDNLEALTVPMFATSIGLNSGIMRNWALEDDEFRALFHQGKELIGVNRFKATQHDMLSEGIFKQHTGNFDIDINEYVRGEKRFDAGLDKETAQAVHSDITDRLDRMHKQMAELQSSALNKAASNIKSDT
jgi:hypothetical protein